MTTGLPGKVMTSDGENRPLSVTHNGTVTSYVYGPDGTRLKKIEKTGTGAENVTVYAGITEIRDWQGVAEEVLNYPVGDVRWKNGPAGAGFETAALHVDQLVSVIAISDATGSFANKRAYAPYGKIADEVEAAGATVETKGFIGERYDEDSGLQYLNARYYDPELALFIQPDWFEVTEFGVGTNRYAYSFNDPVNLRDPNGNFFDEAAALALATAKTTVTVTAETTIALTAATAAVTMALAGAFLAASTTAVGDGTLPDTGNILSPEQVERGDFVDAKGVHRNKDGQEVRTNTSVKTGSEVNGVNPNSLVSRQTQNEMTPNKVNRFRKIIREEGYSFPPVSYADIDGTKVIIDGHHRVEAAMREKVKNIPAVEADVSKDKAKELRSEADAATADRSERGDRF